MKLTKDKLKSWLRKLLQFVFNPRFLLCFGLAWLVTNGWSYILLGLGTYFRISWMIGIAGAYITFLWLPVSPEKLVTFSLAMVLLKFLFPKDEKTLGVLQSFYTDIKQKAAKKKERRRARSSLPWRRNQKGEEG